METALGSAMSDQCWLSSSTVWNKISFCFCVRDLNVSNEHKEAQCSPDGHNSSGCNETAALLNGATLLNQQKQRLICMFETANQGETVWVRRSAT